MGAELVTIAPGDARAFLRNTRDVFVLDVRTEREFKKGHLEDAVLIDYYRRDFKRRIAALDKAEPYLIYCYSGARSKAALRLMDSLGFQNIRHIKGGIRDWKREGLPLVRPK
jgi:rhodanese-related sulfurtransferase